MKKSILLILSLIAALSVSVFAAGCHGKDNSSSGDSQTGGSSTGGTSGSTAIDSEITFNGEDKYIVLTGTSLEGLVTASDANGNAVAVTVKDDGGYKADETGVYNVVYKAGDGAAEKEKSVTVEVASIEIDFSDTKFFVTGEYTLNKPTVVATGKVVAGLSYKIGDAEKFTSVTFDKKGQAKLSFTAPGEYVLKAKASIDGVLLEREYKYTGVGVSANDSAYEANVGKAFKIPAVTFSSNASGEQKYSVAKSGDENFTAVNGDSYTFTEVGYYDVRYSVEVNGEIFSYDHIAYARDAEKVDIDCETVDGKNFYGLGVANVDYTQYYDEFFNKDHAQLDVSSDWSHDGKYSLLQRSGTFWSGIVFTKAKELKSAANALSCYIYSKDDYRNAEILIYTGEKDGEGKDVIATAVFDLKKGEGKYYLGFDKEFTAIKEIRTHVQTGGLAEYYIDSIKFDKLDVSNVLTLGDIAISGSELDAGDSLELPLPQATSTVYTQAQLKKGSYKIYYSADGGEETEVTPENGKYIMKNVITGTYEFRYVFECEGSVAEKTVTVNVAKFDVTANFTKEGTVGEKITVTDIAGYDDGATVTYSVKLNGKEIKTEKVGDGFAFVPGEIGYYTVYIKAATAGKWGELKGEIYVREYDTAMDFDGESHKGYVTSYEPSTSDCYVSLSDEWSYDGRYSIYFAASSTNGWYGLKNINYKTTDKSNALTFVINSVADFTAPISIWVRTSNGDFYSENFYVKQGVKSYTIRFGNTAATAATDPKELGTVQCLAFQYTSGDLKKTTYMDSFTFHPYSAFDADIIKPQIKFNEEYTFTRPVITSEWLTAEEIAALKFRVVCEVNGTTRVIEPIDGIIKYTVTAPGIYKFTLSVEHRYHKVGETFVYAFKTVDINATLPDKIVAAKDVEFEEPTVENGGLKSEEDLSEAEVGIFYAENGSEQFTQLTYKKGKWIFNVESDGIYIIRYVVTVGDIIATKEYEVRVNAAGVFMDFEPNGTNGYVPYPYDNSAHFHAKLTDEWSHEGDYSVKVEFKSGGWYGFTYYDDTFKVPEGTDKISFWVKSDRTMTLPSFLAFSAWDASANGGAGAYQWYYGEEIMIEEGVNLYETRIRSYKDLGTTVKFTPAMAGAIKYFTFHVEGLDESKHDDFGAQMYFDEIRFGNSEDASLNVTLQSATVGKEYTIDYNSPNGFGREKIQVSYRKEGETEWRDIYVTKSYKGEAITYTFDFEGKADIRIIAYCKDKSVLFRGTLTIKK